MDDRGTSRRRVLSIVVAAGLGSGAGCLGRDGAGGDETGGGGTETATATATDAETATDEATTRRTETDEPTDAEESTPAETGLAGAGTRSPFTAYQVDGANTSYVSGATEFPEMPDPAWRRDLPADAFRPAVVDGVVYVSTTAYSRGRPNVFAFDAGSGDQLWETEVAGASYGPPAVATTGGRRRLFLMDSRFSLRAIDAGTGELLWENTPGEHRYGPLRVAVSPGAKAVITRDGPDAGRLVAFDPATGSEQWSVDVDDPFTYHPALADGTVYAVTRDRLYAIDADDGSKQWKTGFEYESHAAPVASNGNVYVAANDGVECYDAASGEQQWSYDEDEYGYGPEDNLVADGDALYVEMFDALRALDGATGEERWRRGKMTEPYIEYQDTDLTGAGETLYLTGASSLFAVGRETGEVRWTYQVDDDGEIAHEPVVVDGGMFLTVDGGDGSSASVLGLAPSGE